MVKWINYVPLENTFNEIEKRIDFKLPKDLKNIIKDYNKGCPSPNKIPLDNGKFAIFDRLLSFNINETFTVYSSITDEMKKQKIIPFGVTDNNNFVCIKGESIILYNVEHNAEKQISENFSDFLNMLE